MTITDVRKKKPEIGEYYNKTKAGMGRLGRYKHNNDKRRMALGMFYDILDISALGGCIIYFENNKIKYKTNHRRIYL